MQKALGSIDTCDRDELLYIMQGFRQKANKNLYRKLRKAIVDRKKVLFPKGAEDESEAKQLANFIFTFASTKPKRFGVYKRYAVEEVEELIAHFEHDLCDAALKVDAEHLTRIAQALYLLKTDDYENIWWRVETRAQELASENRLDGYQLTNLLRSFAHAQNNRTVGSDQLYTAFEPTVLAELSSLSDRDATHVMFAYGVRGLGNPDLHKAFCERLVQCAGQLDYPSAFNAVYYLLFREETDEAIWS